MLIGFASKCYTTVKNNTKYFFQLMKKNISDIMECLRQAESSLITANSYLKEAKEKLRKLEEK